MPVVLIFYVDANQPVFWVQFFIVREGRTLRYRNDIWSICRAKQGFRRAVIFLVKDNRKEQEYRRFFMQ